VAAGLRQRLARGKMRGPGTRPMAMACARPQSAPPASRTLVKPRFNMARRWARRGSRSANPGCKAFRPRLASEASTCTWHRSGPASRSCR
jgi:hypothetical protein